jgi:hypothetical protein
MVSRNASKYFRRKYSRSNVTYFCVIYQFRKVFVSDVQAPFHCNSFSHNSLNKMGVNGKFQERRLVSTFYTSTRRKSCKTSGVDTNTFWIPHSGRLSPLPTNLYGNTQQRSLMRDYGRLVNSERSEVKPIDWRRTSMFGSPFSTKLHKSAI